MPKNNKYHNSKLYYIHGYQSNPTGSKAVLFKKTLQAVPLPYRSGKPEDLVIADCLQNIAQSIAHDRTVTFIGSSLGGFLAAKTALDSSNVTKLILLNPAIIPPSTTFDTHTDVPKRILEEMIEPRLFEEKILAEILILRGTQDYVVPHEWVTKFAMAQQATVRFFHDDHRFTKTLPQLPQLIAQYL